MIHDGEINIFVKRKSDLSNNNCKQYNPFHSALIEKRQAQKWKGTSVNKSIENI